MRFVICRIGSLEMQAVAKTAIGEVICRIGSLEIGNHLLLFHIPVICRIGSLEKEPPKELS